MHAFFACGQDDCTYTADSDPFLDHGVEVRVLPPAPKFYANMWNVPQARKEEDSVMGGTYEPAPRVFAAPVDIASFYSRPVEKKRVRVYGGAPAHAEAVRPALAPGRRVGGIQKKVKQRRGVGRGRGRKQ